MNNFPIAFYILSFGVRWYSVFIMISIICVFISAIIQAKIQKIPIRPLENFLLIGLIFGYIGARIWFLIGNHSYVKSFYDVIAVWNGGVSIEGAAIFGPISGIVYFYRIKHKYKVSMWIYFDIIMTSLLIGQAIGRWGNFFNQEILGPTGSITDFPFNILPSFINNHLHYPNQPNTLRQPLFLYESVLNYLMFIYLCVFVNNTKFINTIPNGKFKRVFSYNSGTKSLLWFAWYGLLRIILEPLRDSVDILKIGSFPISIFISSIFFVFGVFFVLVNENYIKISIWNTKIKNL